jgi:hypothetical protein
MLQGGAQGFISFGHHEGLSKRQGHLFGRVRAPPTPFPRSDLGHQLRQRMIRNGAQAAVAGPWQAAAPQPAVPAGSPPWQSGGPKN